MKDENLEDLTSVVAQEPNLVISMVTENGDVIWFLSDDITEEQEKIFQRFAVVSKSPSIVLLIFLKIEIFLLGISLWIENKIKQN